MKTTIHVISARKDLTEHLMAYALKNVVMEKSFITIVMMEMNLIMMAAHLPAKFKMDLHVPEALPKTKTDVGESASPLKECHSSWRYRPYCWITDWIRILKHGTRSSSYRR